MIRRTKRSGSFWLCLLLNMILNLEWTIPAWILLALHFIFDWSIWWFVLALALWVLNILFWMKLMGWAADCSREKDPPKANKNPYSVKGRSDAPK
jgi:ABC-type transport system involved in Fe-S cluster assembly fused permease/ATPase subunit